MSIGTSVTLSKDSATDVDTNTSIYDLRAADVDSSIFSVAGLTLPAERMLSIRHLTQNNGIVRSAIRIQETVVDTQLVPATLAVSFIVERPPNTAVTNAVLIENANRLIDFLIEGGSNGNLTKVLNREV